MYEVIGFYEFCACMKLLVFMNFVAFYWVLFAIMINFVSIKSQKVRHSYVYTCGGGVEILEGSYVRNVITHFTYLYKA